MIQDPDVLPTGLKVLSLGFTQDLWEDENGVQGDTLKRLIANSRYLSYYAVVSHSFRRHRLATPRKINETFWTYATNAVTPIDAWSRMFKLGLRIGRNHPLDLIQTQDPFLTGSVGHCLSRKLGVPLNVCVYGSNPFDVHWRRDSWINWLGTPWAKDILKSAAGIQADGAATIQSLVTSGIPENRIAYKPVVPNDLSQFFSAKRDEGLRKELSADGRFDHLALFVGRFVPQKNLRLLLEVASKLTVDCPKLRFFCVGEGPEHGRLRSMTQRLGLGDKVVWLAALPHREVPRYMASCDSFVLCSRYEGFAKVLMEAAAAALPIVTTAVSGSEDAVLHGITGFIVPIDDGRSFASSLAQLVGDPGLAAGFGEGARRHLTSFVERCGDPRLQIRVWNEVVKRWKTTATASV